MAYKRFSRQFVGPFTLLVMLVCALAYTLVIAKWYIISIILLTFTVGLLIYLKKQLDTVNQQLTRVFEQSRGNDFATRLSLKSTDKSLKALYQEINRWQQHIQELRQARAQASEMTSEVLNHLPVGVFLMNKKAALVFSNDAARDFLNCRGKSDEAFLKDRAPYLFNHLEELRKNRNLNLNLERSGEKQQWQITYRRFYIEGEQFELFITQNIQANLERTQGHLSEQIMHVLTHEIMNSISPVHSLIDTLNLRLVNIQGTGDNIEMDRETYDDLLTGAEIIKKRSEGLMEFVERYGMLARLPRLEMSTVQLDEFLGNLKRLISTELQNHKIEFELQVIDKSMRMRADVKLLEQVIINIVKNARESFEGGDGHILLSFSKGDGYNYISVSDNGKGVSAEIEDKIFLPFFTTKKRGSGIGLSLSRKIIDAHNGRLFLRQANGKTEFRIELPD